MKTTLYTKNCINLNSKTNNIIFSPYKYTINDNYNTRMFNNRYLVTTMISLIINMLYRYYTVMCNQPLLIFVSHSIVIFTVHFLSVQFLSILCPFIFVNSENGTLATNLNLNNSNSGSYHNNQLWQNHSAFFIFILF